MAKRKSQQTLLPKDLISSLEESDKKASKKRKKQFNSHTLPKSLATKSLYNIHTNLIECRILLQRALTCYDDENVNDATRTNKGLERLLNQLVNSRDILCKQVLQKQTSPTDDEDDTSSNHDDDAYNKLKNQWKTILNRQHDNLNITKRFNNKKDSNSKFFQVVDQSFWTQIDNTVQHNKILDQHDQIQNNDNGDGTSKPKVSFDDSKIYQHMLQEYITLSTERTTNNATSIAEHRLKLASENKKKNKDDVDRRASKGRKIRYVVHEKLQNFTFPLQREVVGRNNHVIMDEDVLFKSMMGGVSSSRKTK